MSFLQTDSDMHDYVSRRAALTGFASLAASALVAPGFAQDGAQIIKPGQTPKQVADSDLLYVPTPDAVITRMFEMAQIRKDDLLIDLGSGDGRIPIQAAQKFGTRGRGVDLIAERVDIARANARAAGVEHLVSFEQGDALQVKISDASVVTLYLFPHVMAKLRPRLERELKSGTRVVSHEFTMEKWTPVESVQVGKARVHLWIMP